MGALIATLFTVIAVAISSFAISGQLSTRQAVAPNAPESKPAASGCGGTCRSNCNEDETGSGTSGCSGGQYCCNSNGGATPTTPPTDSNSCAGPDSAEICKNKRVGDTICVHNTLRCSRTTPTNCSAFDTGVQCEGPTPTITTVPEVVPTATQNCYCIGSCGSSTCFKGSSGPGAPCDMKYCEGWQPAKCDGKPNGTTECNSNEKSFRYCNDGKWENNNCVSNYVCPVGGNKCSAPATPTSSYCNVALQSTSACGANGCLATQVEQTWKNVSCGTTKKCVESSVCKSAVCKDGQYRCDGTTSVSCLNGQFNGVKQNCASYGCNSTSGKCNPAPNPTVIVSSTPTNIIPVASLSPTKVPAVNLGRTLCQDPMGTPGVSQICNNAGGYNYCSSDGIWYSRKCDNGAVCKNGSCILVTPTAATIAGIGDKCDEKTPCSTGYCYSGNQVLGGSPFDSTKTCHVNSIAVMDETQKDLATNTAIGEAAILTAVVAAPVVADIAALAVAGGGISAVPLAATSYVTTALSSLPAWTGTALTVAGTLPGAYFAGKCLYGSCTQDEQMAAFMTGVGVQQLIDQKMVESIASDQKIISNNFNNIPDEVVPSGNIAKNAGLSIVNNKYVSGGGNQTVVINPNKDAVLQQTLNDASDYIANLRTTSSESRVPLAQKYVTGLFPDYDLPTSPNYSPEAVIVKQQAIYANNQGVVDLGQFIECKAAVCREQALILHTVLANEGKASAVTTGYLGSGGKHAWVEYLDTVTNQKMVADSVWDFVLPSEEAYQVYGGVSSLTTQVFAKP